MNKSELDRAIEALAGRLGITPNQLLNELEQKGAGPDCLRPDEMDDMEQISSTRLQHLDGCAFCQSMVEGTHRVVERARQFAASAAAAWKFDLEQRKGPKSRGRGSDEAVSDKQRI